MLFPRREVLGRYIILYAEYDGEVFTLLNLEDHIDRTRVLQRCKGDSE